MADGSHIRNLSLCLSLYNSQRELKQCHPGRWYINGGLPFCPERPLPQHYVHHMWPLARPINPYKSTPLLCV